MLVALTGDTTRGTNQLLRVDETRLTRVEITELWLPIDGGGYSVWSLDYPITILMELPPPSPIGGNPNTSPPVGNVR